MTEKRRGYWQGTFPIYYGTIMTFPASSMPPMHACKPGEWRIYVDGYVEAERTDILKTPKSNALPLWIGNEQKTTGRSTDGIIDEVRIYNEALPENWIKLHSMGYYGGGFIGDDNLAAVNLPAPLRVQILDAYDVGAVGVPVTFTSDPVSLKFDDSVPHM